ncbi:BCCT family transporter [Corynebacterium sp.]|uniref:BCCT family transporter n=1 Tax=Corynebacterium sp. TaxID=1720 RepID=UPI0026DCCAB3|nr:BCCT family transporter [Corynebacterium sp.]MDO4611134.1 BCCT family transporter [Corynebacterium sp.]
MTTGERGSAPGRGTADGGLGQVDYGGGINWAVVAPTLVLSLAIVAWGLVAPDSFGTAAAEGLDWVVTNLGWLFALIATLIVVFVVALGFSKYGAIRLGRDDERPEFSTPSWIAMMFAAGMGIGLMFYGAYEPLNHYINPPPGASEAAPVATAFAHTLLHWTIHPWSMYAVVGLAIAYATFRMGRKQLISSAFIPLIGVRRAEGPLGKLIDVLAIFSTIFGTATSLAVGATQVGAGLDFVGFIGEPTTGTYVLVIVILGVAYLLSAMSGVSRGIQLLSNVNMVFAVLLAVFVLFAGPTMAVLDSLPIAVGSYFDQFLEMTSRTAASADGTAGEWLSSWTLFWWAWWISWSPFVGMFLARISRGRTIREYLFGVVAVPSGVSTVWFCVFGGTAIHLEQLGHSIWGDGTPETVLFRMLDTMPWSTVSSIIAMILLCIFFVSSADSASTVMATMSQNGRVIPSPWMSAVWGVMTAVVAIVMLVSGGQDALSNLQNIIIVAGTPFLLIAALLILSLLKGFTDDPLYLDEKERRRFALQLARERRIAGRGARRPHPGAPMRG